MPKPQLLLVFDQQIRAHRLIDGRHQRRRLAFQHRGQQTSREPVGSTAATRTNSPAPLDKWPSRCFISPTSRQRVPAGHRAAAAHVEPPLLVQTPDQLADEEGIAVRLGGQSQSDSSAFARTASETMWATAPGDIGATRTNAASARCSADNVS